MFGGKKKGLNDEYLEPDSEMIIGIIDLLKSEDFKQEFLNMLNGSEKEKEKSPKKYLLKDLNPKNSNYFPEKYQNAKIRLYYMSLWSSQLNYDDILTAILNDSTPSISSILSHFVNAIWEKVGQPSYDAWVLPSIEKMKEVRLRKLVYSQVLNKMNKDQRKKFDEDKEQQSSLRKKIDGLFDDPSNRDSSSYPYKYKKIFDKTNINKETLLDKVFYDQKIVTQIITLEEKYFKIANGMKKDMISTISYRLKSFFNEQNKLRRLFKLKLKSKG